MQRKCDGVAGVGDGWAGGFLHLQLRRLSHRRHDRRRLRQRLSGGNRHLIGQCVTHLRPGRVHREGNGAAVARVQIRQHPLERRAAIRRGRRAGVSVSQRRVGR